MSTTYKEPIFCGSMSGKLTQFTSANGTTQADITTADPNGPIRVDSLTVSNTDTAAGLMTICMQDAGANVMALANIPIPANSLSTAGTTPPLNLLAHANMAPFVGADAAGNKFLELPAGWRLRAGMLALPTANCYFTVQARWGAYAAA